MSRILVLSWVLLTAMFVLFTSCNTSNQIAIYPSSSTDESLIDHATSIEENIIPDSTATGELEQSDILAPKYLNKALKEGFKCNRWLFYDDSSIILLQYNNNQTFLSIYNFIDEQVTREIPLSIIVSSDDSSSWLNEQINNGRSIYAIQYDTGRGENSSYAKRIDKYDNELNFIESIDFLFPEKAYHDGPREILDDNRILYVTEIRLNGPDSDLKEHNLYIANSDGSNEKMLINCINDFGSRLYHVETNGDYFVFSTTNGTGIYYIPSEKYQFFAGAYDYHLLDNGKIYLYGSHYLGQIGRITPILYNFQEDSLISFDQLKGFVLFGISNNARYLYDLGAIWPFPDNNTVNIYDIREELLYTGNYSRQAFNSFDNIIWEQHMLSNDGKNLIYYDGEHFLLMEAEWNKAEHLAL